MVTFLITRRHRYTIEIYLDQWAPDLRSQVRSLGYEDLPAAGELEPGTYVFCDQERWKPRQHRLAIALWEQLESAGPAVALLNDPRRVLLRYALLKKLHRQGLNVFNVHTWSAGLFRSRLPAFLHSHGGHEGPLSPRLNSRASLLRWLAFVSLRHPRKKLMVEEFCDVARSGIYAKYGAFNLSGTIMPRHVFFGKEWSLKDTEIRDEETFRQFENYLLENPHASELRQIFDLAGIDFGRVDYAFHQGRLQVWEINTNPMIISSRHEFQPEEILLADLFNRQIKPEFLRLSSLSQGGSPVRYHLPERF